jgi:hypothetical protein
LASDVQFPLATPSKRRPLQKILALDQDAKRESETLIWDSVPNWDLLAEGGWAPASLSCMERHESIVLAGLPTPLRSRVG